MYGYTLQGSNITYPLTKKKALFEDDDLPAKTSGGTWKSGSWVRSWEVWKSVSIVDFDYHLVDFWDRFSCRIWMGWYYWIVLPTLMSLRSCVFFWWICFSGSFGGPKNVPSDSRKLLSWSEKLLHVGCHIEAQEPNFRVPVQPGPAELQETQVHIFGGRCSKLEDHEAWKNSLMVEYFCLNYLPLKWFAPCSAALW